jgi:hypothetical protein
MGHKDQECTTQTHGEDNAVGLHAFASTLDPLALNSSTLCTGQTVLSFLQEASQSWGRSDQAIAP